MKKALKITGIVAVVLIVLLVGGCFILNEKLPVGQPGPEADRIAQQMMAAVNKPAWDSTRYVSWTFGGRHHFFWDKQANLVEVTWKDYRALVDPETGAGQAYEAGVAVTGEAQDKLLEKARQYFFNDGFWLNAVVKANDPGTERSLVTLKDGRQGLKVQYTSGGTTPGDSYVWILDENHRPTAWKMWVQILPIGGLEVQWTDWDTLSTGAIIAQTRHTSIMDIKMTDLKAGQTLQEMGRNADPFAEME